MRDLRAAFEQHDEEFGKFDRIESKLHPRPDLCAFLLLDSLVPHTGYDIVSAAEHDGIYLDTDCEALNIAATDADILTLVRCGVMYDGVTEGLMMFV